MKKRMWGTIALSFAVAGAVVVPTTIGIVHAATNSSLEDGFPTTVAELEGYYENLLPDLISGNAAGAVRGSDVYGSIDANDTVTNNGASRQTGKIYWNEYDINPCYDNVTLSYTYKSTKAAGAKGTAIGSAGFGFRFTIDGIKHVSLLRHQRTLFIAQYDTESVGNVNVKLNVDDYFRETGGQTPGTKYNVNNVNTDKFVQVLSSNNGASNGSGIFGNDNQTAASNQGLPAITAVNGTAAASDKVTVEVPLTLRKVTDEDGTVTFRYYEQGNYILSLQFEGEVTAYAPNLVNPDADHLSAHDFKVTLNDPYTEYDKVVDAAASNGKVFLNVGDSVEYSFVRRVQSSPVPMISLVWGESGGGVVINRFATRLHLDALTAWSTRNQSLSKIIYMDNSSQTDVSKLQARYRTAGFVDIVCNSSSDAGDFATASSGYKAVASNSTAMTMDFRIERVPNEILDKDGTNVECAVYELYAADNAKSADDLDLLTRFGIPVSEFAPGETGVTFYGWQVNTTSPDLVAKTKLSSWSNLADEERDGDETIEWESWTDSTVRFTADTRGLRFSVSVAKDLITLYKAYYGNVEFGIKLARGDGKSALIPAVNYTEEGGRYYFNGVVANIAPEHYATQYEPYLYIKFGDGKMVTSSAGTAKSIREVAQEMLDTQGDVLTEAKKEILRGYTS